MSGSRLAAPKSLANCLQVFAIFSRRGGGDITLVLPFQKVRISCFSHSASLDLESAPTKILLNGISFGSRVPHKILFQWVLGHHTSFEHNCIAVLNTKAAPRQPAVPHYFISIRRPTELFAFVLKVLPETEKMHKCIKWRCCLSFQEVGDQHSPLS